MIVTHDYMFYVTALCGFLFDRITKYGALLMCKQGPIALMPGFQLHLAYNTGISFSFFSNNGSTSHWLLTLVIAIIVTALVVIWRFFSSHTPRSDVAYGMIIAGAVGNFFDRLVYGAVIDFLDISLYGYHWPTFNGADVLLTIGFFLLIKESLHETRS